MSSARARVAAPQAARERAKNPARRSRRTRSDSHAEKIREKYEAVALVLQGGGALGAYQCGVYEALHGAGIHPGWFAGTSIGAINAAILAGNAPEQRIERLHEFWNTICEPAGAFAWQASMRLRDALAWLPPNGAWSAWMGTLSAFGALAQGQRGFFCAAPGAAVRATAGQLRPRPASTTPRRCERRWSASSISIASIAGDVRLTVGAANVRNGNFRYFDSAKERIRPEHIMASGALPPAFPAIEIDGEHYWDGGIVSNTPLECPARSRAAARHAGVPGRFVERARNPAENVARRARAAEGHPVLEPHAPRHRHGRRAPAAAQRARLADGRDSEESICRRSWWQTCSPGCAIACSTSSI